MFTRFQTSTAVHVLDAPLIKIPPDTPGGMFLAALGGAYENQEEHLRSRILQFADDLDVALQQPDLKARSGVEAFHAGLRSVIEFLHSVDENTVWLYSYDRAPSIEDLIDAFGEGGGARDWALEELGKKGEKGRKALLAVLKKEHDNRKIMSALSMLMILFRDQQTKAAVQKFIDTCDADIGKEAALLRAAYAAVDGEEAPPFPSLGSSSEHVGQNMNNIFDDLPRQLPKELVQILVQAGDVRIERIISCGHASPADFWYDQPQHEWVIVLKGAARLQFEDGMVEMKVGDFINIPAFKKHRVDWTTPDEPTVWLGVRYGEAT